MAPKTTHGQYDHPKVLFASSFQLLQSVVRWRGGALPCPPALAPNFSSRRDSSCSKPMIILI
ncbi:hypothetical protein HanHA300_Chr12g0430731 [Helianthus annuus]|nr:hypothetical protein HanHA300_Chr12g0430731 [Helianthus annuus]KAJ0504071.1 hypothetical protein HanHA89_Chr12g0455251 [Helianthus annuus]KAJ0673771.1 hypothetical protein HanLR1_Chr12g0432691 [Helianthus annuus]KAJ0677128.1 hypothetical protein HanOQP8_Chr12g0433481 [Helianthus annuus]